MKLLIVIILGIFLAGCSTQKPQLDKKYLKITRRIKRLTRKICISDANCEIRNCWKESKNITICNVDFGLAEDQYVVEIMTKLSNQVNVEKLDVEFRANASSSAQIAAGILTGIVVGFIGAAF